MITVVLLKSHYLLFRMLVWIISCWDKIVRYKMGKLKIFINFLKHILQYFFKKNNKKLIPDIF